MWRDSTPAPCTRNCPDRSVEPNCHMTCEAYLEFKRKVAEEKTRETAGRSKEADARRYQMEQSIKIRKRYNR